MGKKKTGYIVALVVLVGAINGGVFYTVMKHNKQLSNKQFAQLPIEKQFEKAPNGHYVHLLKNDPTLYRTTWRKSKIKNHILYKSGHVKTKPDGMSDEKINFGTNHTFDDLILVNLEKGYGEIGSIFFAQLDNHNFIKDIEYDPETSYNWYFDNLKDAQTDADVAANVNQIVR